MHLIIENPEGLDLDKFMGWLCVQIRDLAISQDLGDKDREKAWNEYLASEDFGWARDETGNPVAPTVAYIINGYFNNLGIGRQGQDYVISIKSDVKLKGTLQTINAIASLINDGNLSMAPYPYFESIFETIGRSIDGLYALWLSSEGSEEEEEG